MYPLTSKPFLICLSVLEPLDQLTGEGLLFGFVQEEDGTGGRIEKTKRVGGAGVSARRVQGTGRGKETYEIVAYVFTNEEGQFSIDGLPPGEYRFNVQYPGYPMDEESFIDFTIGTNALEETVQVVATVDNRKIIVRELLITGLTENPDWKIDVFPNPTTESIFIKFDEKNAPRSITLRDATGKTLLRRTVSEQESILSFKDLPVGMYQLTLKGSKGKQKIVKVMKN